MGRLAKFTSAQLQAAALKIVDEQGLENLTMRNLAAVLGTGAMTLYNYVSSRDGLDLLVIDAIFSEIKIPKIQKNNWKENVNEIALALWRGLRMHPKAIPLVLTKRSRSPAVLNVSELLLGALAKSGRRDVHLLSAFRAVTALIMGYAQVELGGLLTTRIDETKTEILRRFQALPPDQYPKLIEIANAAYKSDAEVEFKDGLQRLLHGLTHTDV